MQTKEINTPSLLALGYELIKAGAEGWEMDENDTLYQMGFGAYHVGLIKVEEHRVAVLSAFPPNPAKMSIPPQEDSEKRKPGRPKIHSNNAV